MRNWEPTSRSTQPRRRGLDRKVSRHLVPERPRVKLENWPGAKERSTPGLCQGSLPTVRKGTLPRAKFSSLKEILLEGQQNKVETAAPKRFFPCAEKFSMWKKPASTRCSLHKRSG